MGIKKICDMCGENSGRLEKEWVMPKGWTSINFDMTYGGGKKRYDLCTECAKKLQLPTETTMGGRNEKIQDRLLDILLEIVHGEIQQN